MIIIRFWRTYSSPKFFNKSRIKFFNDVLPALPVIAAF